MVERDGWQLPSSYVGVDEERAAVHAGLGLADLSAFVKISIQGRGVADLVRALVGDSPASKVRGVTVWDADGRVLACRLTEDDLFLLTLTTRAAALRARLTALRLDLPVVEREVSCAYAAFCLLGTATENTLRHLTVLDVRRSAFPVGSCTETSLAGVHAVLARPPEAALDTIHVAVAWDLAEHVWERLLDAGRNYGIAPVGLEAWYRLTSPPLG